MKMLSSLRQMEIIPSWTYICTTTTFPVYPFFYCNSELKTRIDARIFLLLVKHIRNKASTDRSNRQLILFSKDFSFSFEIYRNFVFFFLLLLSGFHLFRLPWIDGLHTTDWQTDSRFLHTKPFRWGIRLARCKLVVWSQPERIQGRRNPTCWLLAVPKGPFIRSLSSSFQRKKRTTAASVDTCQ